ncbi:MAG: TRAP transporter substrate-binding protein [Alphaproteobacteria bacterium]|nr:TRAP transporter substrate-binding protein [Alphaproteobacteria bacterium]
MKLTNFAVGLACALLLAGGAGAQDKKVRWKMASAFPGTLDVVGEAGPRFSKLIDRISGGTMEIKFFEPGALVPALQTHDPVATGSIDAAWTAAGYNVGKVPASPWFTSVPFGPSFSEFMAWLTYGGGDEIRDDLYARVGIKGLHCNAIVPEASGWFRKEIKSVAELKGLKMRFFGLGAKVMEKLGVSTQLLAAGDIYPALELGTIDATEISFPSMDLRLGVHQVAKHYYFPGWHQLTTILEFIANGEKWRALSDQQKAMVEAACSDSIRWGIATSDSRQFKALNEIKAKGVTLHYWPKETLAAMKDAWDQVVKEESAKDADFKRTADSYNKFRTDYAIWRELGYLKD